MKRSKGLKRTGGLKRSQGLSRGKGLSRGQAKVGPGGLPAAKVEAAKRLLSRRARRRDERGYDAWHVTHRGECEVCRKPGPLERHHAVQESYIRRYGGNPWDLRWAIELGRHCRCHQGHHNFGVNDTRLDFKYVRPETVRLAVETMGAGPAERYFQQHYRNAPDQLSQEGDADGGK